MSRAKLKNSRFAEVHMRLPALRHTLAAAALVAGGAFLSLSSTPASAAPATVQQVADHHVMHRPTPHAVRAAEHRRRHRVWRHGHWVYYWR